MRKINSQALHDLLAENQMYLSYKDGVYRFHDHNGRMFDTLNGHTPINYILLMKICNLPHILFPVKYWKTADNGDYMVEVTACKNYRMSFLYAKELLIELGVFSYYKEFPKGQYIGWKEGTFVYLGSPTQVVKYAKYYLERAV